MQFELMSRKPYIGIVYDVIEYRGVKVRDVHADIRAETRKKFINKLIKIKTDFDVAVDLLIMEADKNETQNKDTNI